MVLYNQFSYLIWPGIFFLYAVLTGPIKEGFFSYQDCISFVPASAFLRCADKGCTLHNIVAEVKETQARKLDQEIFKLGEGRCDGNSLPFFPSSFVRLSTSAVVNEFMVVSDYLSLPPLRPKGHWSAASFDILDDFLSLCDAEFGLLLAHIAWMNSFPNEAPALAQRLARASHGFYAPADAVMPSKCLLPASSEAAAAAPPVVPGVALRAVEVEAPGAPKSQEHDVYGPL